MRGWSFHVGVNVWPPSWWVEFAPAVEKSEEEPASSVSVSDTPIEVEDFAGTYINRLPMGFTPVSRKETPAWLPPSDL